MHQPKKTWKQYHICHRRCEATNFMWSNFAPHAKFWYRHVEQNCSTSSNVAPHYMWSNFIMWANCSIFSYVEYFVFVPHDKFTMFAVLIYAVLTQHYLESEALFHHPIFWPGKNKESGLNCRIDHNFVHIQNVPKWGGEQFPHFTALWVKQWKLRRSKVFKFKTLLRVQLLSKNIQTFVKLWKTSRTCSKYNF